jgi:hypothetical protein
MAEPGYASRFEEARKEAIELLEGEARRRAEKGLAEPVIYKGRLCYREVIDKNGQRRQVPLVIRRYSDALLNWTRLSRLTTSIRLPVR